MASTAALVHAMVVAGCFGSQGCLWVAISYMKVLADIAAEYDYGWAAAYDLVIRHKGEQDPTFMAATALPLYVEVNKSVMLDLNMRLTPPPPLTSPPPCQGAGGTDHAAQQARQGPKRDGPD